jgi:hypothetical protein
VRDALASIAAFLNAVNAHYMNTTALFDIGGNQPGGAYVLLRYLKQGIDAQAEAFEKMKRGELKPRALDFTSL